MSANRRFIGAQSFSSLHRREPNDGPTTSRSIKAHSFIPLNHREPSPTTSRLIGAQPCSSLHHQEPSDGPTTRRLIGTQFCGSLNHHEPSGVPTLPRAWKHVVEFDRDAHLGRGAFAEMFKVKDKITGGKFALKVVQRQFYVQRSMEPQLNMEIEALRKCASSGHTNHVVQLHDYIEENGVVFLRMELCTANLKAVAMQLAGHRIPERAMATWARQLCLGLQEIHSLSMIHRDIKPENLLLSFDLKLKIVDFGWCVYKGDLSRSSNGALAGTFRYMAPEVLEDAPQTEAVDMWSSGATLFEFLTGQILIASDQQPTGHSATCPRQAAKVTSARILAEITQKCPLSEHGRPSYLSTECWAFCKHLLMPRVPSRMLLRCAQKHPWLCSGSWKSPANRMTMNGPPAPLTISPSPLAPRTRSPTQLTRHCGLSACFPHPVVQSARFLQPHVSPRNTSFCKISVS